MNCDILRVSFQDPDGFVFSYKNKMYRVVLVTYSEDLNVLVDLGILESPQLVKHTEIDINSFPTDIISWLFGQINGGTFLTIFELDKIQFITYPWEWTPLMLQQAAEFTLNFQAYLLEKGLTLKDASFYNVQFINGNPIFIDLLSIKRSGNKIYPWFAYGQFLQHFVFPLIMLKYGRFDSLQFLQAYPDGIKKAEVIGGVSLRSYFSIFELLHIHLFKHLNKEQKNSDVGGIEYSKNKQKEYLKQLILFATKYVKKTYTQYSQNSQWINYYEENTIPDYTREKEKIFIEFIERLGKIEKAVDLGANTGLYSQILIKRVQHVLSVEQDSICCEIVRSKIKKLRPNQQWQIICSNLLYPSPAIGWLNRERRSLIERLRSQLVTALAIIHHFYFSGSIDFIQIAELFNSISTCYVIVEFVGRDDDKVIFLSKKNDSRLAFYTEENFIKAMSLYFTNEVTKEVSSTRNLFLFKKNA